MATLLATATVSRVLLGDEDGSSFKPASLTSLIAQANREVYSRLGIKAPMALVHREADFTVAGSIRSLTITGATYINDAAFWRLLYLGEMHAAGPPTYSNQPIAMRFADLETLDGDFQLGEIMSYGNAQVRPSGQAYSLAGNTLFLQPVSSARYFHAIYLRECATIAADADYILSDDKAVKAPLGDAGVAAVAFLTCSYAAGRMGQDPDAWHARYETELDRLGLLSCQRAQHVWGAL